MRSSIARFALVVMSALALVVSLGGAPAGASVRRPARGHAVWTHRLRVHVILAGASIEHAYAPAGGGPVRTETLTKPDDITRIGDRLFVGFQNGVGAQGEPSADGNTASTIVEFSRRGAVIGQWDIVGKCDGLTAAGRMVIATVNEDGDSSIYVIDPSSPGVAQHYVYNEQLPHNGGTDSIAVVDGHVLVSASAPGATGGPAAPNAAYPAVYEVVRFDRATHVATVRSLFSDEASAITANRGSHRGSTVTLGLTDPDSSEHVPSTAPRFAGDFALDSQGDLEQIYSPDPTASHPRLKALDLSQSIDDTAFTTDADGVLFATDSTHDTVVAVTGRFQPGEAVVAVTPCGANSAPATCPAAPAFPPNYLGVLNLFTGSITELPTAGAAFVPQGGLLFVAERSGR